MKRTLMILIIVAGPLLFAGCPETPMGTVAVKNADGDDVGLAWDRKPYDGVADVNEDGTPDLVLGANIYKVANQADSFGPTALAIAASFGVPFVGAIGIFWRKHKLAKMTANLVAAIQAGRASVNASGAKGSLEILDNALANAQHPDTAAMVADLKEAAGLPSVSSP